MIQLLHFIGALLFMNTFSFAVVELARMLGPQTSDLGSSPGGIFFFSQGGSLGFSGLPFLADEVPHLPLILMKPKHRWQLVGIANLSIFQRNLLCVRAMEVIRNKDCVPDTGFGV